LNAVTRAPIGPDTVDVLGSRWRPGRDWDGFRWELASVGVGIRGQHLRAPWLHPEDIKAGRQWRFAPIYRLRLKEPWQRFVKVDGLWMVEKDDA
jgi:hypothetical protein